MPKRERSSYRTKRKDKKAAQIRGAQGAVTKDAATSVNPKSNQTTKGSSQNASAKQLKPSSKSRKKNPRIKRDKSKKF